MSDSTAFALVIASFFAGSFLVFYVSKIGKDIGDEIVSGVAHNAPIPLKHRWMMLYLGWVSYGCGVVGAAVATAVMNMTIAGNASNPDVRLAAHVAAFLHAVVILLWVGLGPILFTYYRSVLRQAEAD